MTTEHIATPSRVDVSTLSNYLKMKTEPIFTKDVFFGGLKAHGRLSFNHGGKDINWTVKFRRRRITEADGYNSGQAFPQTTVTKRASIPWRRFRLGESVTKFEKLANKGEARLFDALGNIIDDCMDDFLVDFQQKVFDNGYATGSKTLMGFESMFASTSTELSSLGVVGTPAGTYGNLTQTLGTYGGEWTPDTGSAWPTGQGDTEYHFWSSLIADYTSDNTTPGWKATTKTWPNTWMEVLRFLMAYQSIIQKHSFDFCILATNLLLQAKQSLESAQRFELTQNSPLTEAGFKTLAFEGIELFDQYGVPSSVGYLFSWDKISLLSMQKQLIDVEQDHDIEDSSDLYALDSFCNLKFASPAYVAKMMSIT